MLILFMGDFMNSIWLNENSKINNELNKLDKNLRTQVCIIGGGITGISVAYELTKNNVSTKLTEFFEKLNNWKNELDTITPSELMQKILLD